MPFIFSYNVLCDIFIGSTSNSSVLNTIYWEDDVIDNLLDNDMDFEEVDEDPTNDTNLEDEGSTDDEIENEEST
jgi:hypothetical protein